MRPPRGGALPTHVPDGWKPCSSRVPSPRTVQAPSRAGVSRSNTGFDAASPPGARPRPPARAGGRGAGEHLSPPAREGVRRGLRRRAVELRRRLRQARPRDPVVCRLGLHGHRLPHHRPPPRRALDDPHLHQVDERTRGDYAPRHRDGSWRLSSALPEPHDGPIGPGGLCAAHGRDERLLEPLLRLQRERHAAQPLALHAQLQEGLWRVVLILRGGDVARIDARLHRLHMPRLHGASAALPTPKVSFLWDPEVWGDPNVSGNVARAYWPGARFVDWVGTDFYSKFPNYRGLNAFYHEFRGKPFAFGEWA